MKRTGKQKETIRRTDSRTRHRKTYKRSPIPKKTRKDTEYSAKTFDEWREGRYEEIGVAITSLNDLNNEQLDKCLSCFILEVRK